MGQSFIGRTGWSPFKWPGERKEAKEAHERVQALVSLLDTEPEGRPTARDLPLTSDSRLAERDEDQTELFDLNLFPSMVPIGPSNFLQFRYLDSDAARSALEIVGHVAFSTDEGSSITLVAASFEDSLGTPRVLARRFAETFIEPRLEPRRGCIISYESIGQGFVLTVTQIRETQAERSSVADRIYIAERGQGIGFMPSLQDIRADEGRGRSGSSVITNR